MGDGDDGSAVSAQVLLQPADRLVVEVVGRFVEQQQFRFGGEGRGEREPGALAAGQGAEPAVRVEPSAFAEAAQGGRDPPFGSRPPRAS